MDYKFYAFYVVKTHNYQDKSTKIEAIFLTENKAKEYINYIHSFHVSTDMTIEKCNVPTDYVKE